MTTKDIKHKADHPFKKSGMPLPVKIFFGLTALLLKLLGSFSPKLAGRLALNLFMKPPNAAAPAREQKVRDGAKLSYRKINNNKIALRVWDNETTKKDAPTVLLSHGWAGRTSQFFTFIDPLLDAGYRVVGADIPAHGDSSGKRTNMIEATQVLSIIAKEFGPLAAIIGHSFGTGTILLGLDQFGIKSQKIVLIGAYSHVSFIIDLFSDVFDLSQASRKAMQQAGSEKFADTYGIKWDWESIAPVNTIKSYQGELLLIHDNNDNEVPLTEVEELHQAKAGAENMLTSGLGHRRILRNQDVVNRVLAFIEDNHKDKQEKTL